MHIGLNEGGIVFYEGAVGNCDCCGGGPPDPCPDGICPYPTLDLTLTWTDADATKDYLGKTFTNGQTHEICPQTYYCESLGTHRVSGLFREFWQVAELNNGFLDENVKVNNNGATYSYAITQNGRAIGMYFKADTQYYDSFIVRDAFVENNIEWGIGPTNSTDPRGQDAFKIFNERHRVFNNTTTSIPLFTIGYTYQWMSGQGAQPAPMQSFSALGITDGYNGTYTTESGITVTWARKLSSPCSSLEWGACF